MKKVKINTVKSFKNYTFFYVYGLSFSFFSYKIQYIDELIKELMMIR